jgi:hypothetical protein
MAMSRDWSPFSSRGPDAPADAAPDAAEDRRISGARAAFATPAAKAWLRARYLEEVTRPSFSPGMDFETVAWREGRKAILRELVNDVFPATPATPE